MKFLKSMSYLVFKCKMFKKKFLGCFGMLLANVGKSVKCAEHIWNDKYRVCNM